jgi:murein hydrolase activator
MILQEISMRKILFFLICTIAASITKADTQVNNSELLNVSWQVSRIQKAPDIEQTQEAESQQKLQNRDTTLNELNQEMTLLNQQLSAEQAAIEKLQASQKLYLDRLNKQRAALANQIRIMYKLGKSESAKTMLNPDNLNTINRHLYYTRNLNTQRTKLVKEVKQIIDTLSNNMQEAEKHQRKLKNLLAQKEKEQTQLSSLQKENTADDDNKSNSAPIPHTGSSIANQKALQEVIGALPKQKLKIHSIPFEKLQGKLQWPVPSNTLTKKISTVTGALTGVVIKAPETTPVHAIYHGKVIFANWLRGYGLLVIIDHGNGYMSLYGRNRTLFTTVGDQIKARQVIAASGSSGGYQYPSLYFEIRKDGTPLDPKVWCHA